MPISGDAVEKELAGSKLPPLPHVLVELLRACQDQSSSFEDMAKIVASDAVIAAQLIMVANTSYYSRAGNIQTIERALLLLGTDALKTMAITASVQQMCNGFQPAKPAYYKSYWQRSLRCALIAKALAHLTSFASPDEAYLVGLLHNIGELVLAVNHPDAYPELLALVNGGSQTELEAARFQTNHCELGGFLASQWGLDAFAADAIAYHHEPASQVADAQHLTKLIYLAAKLAEEPLHPAAGKGDYINLAGIEAAERLFDLSGALAREIAAKVSGDVSRIAKALGIDLQDDSHQDMAEMKTRLGQQLQRRLVNQEMSTILGRTGGAAVEPATISQAVNIMFGYRQTLLLEYDSAQNSLRYTAPGASSGAINIALATSESLVAGSAGAAAIKWSHVTPGGEASLTVVDRQLIRLCGANSMICVPLVAGIRLMGMLVMGDASTTPPDSVSLALLQDFAGHVTRMLDAEAEQEVVTDAKLARLQEKMRTAVHEANNPLTIIRNYLEALSSSAGESDGDAQKEYGMLRDEVDRASQILMRLQDLEQDAAETPQAMSLNQEIRSLVTVFQQSICRSNKVDCKVKLSSKLEKAVLPRNQLRQIVTNLVKNAVEAMPNGGEIRISSAEVISSAKGKTAELLIADNGPGLPDHIISKLFQPGYSTKDGNHSGLGLSITRSLVEEIGGLITCQSGERGTQFRIVLPIS